MESKTPPEAMCVRVCTCVCVCVCVCVQLISVSLTIPIVVSSIILSPNGTGYILVEKHATSNTWTVQKDVLQGTVHTTSCYEGCLEISQDGKCGGIV